MRRVHKRTVQIYTIRPSGEISGRRFRNRLARLSLFTLVPVFFGLLSFWYAQQAMGNVGSADAVRYLTLSVGMAVACDGFFTGLGQTFLCADGVEELVRSGRNIRWYERLLSFTVIPPAAGLMLMVAALRHAPSLTADQNGLVLEGCELFALFSIGAFLAGFLPSRVTDDISTPTGRRKRLSASMSGHAVVVTGLVVALLVFRSAGII